MVNGWIQSSDFSISDLPEMQDAHQAIWQLSTHDWAEEAFVEETRRTAGEMNCPAGIGFNSERNREILHICPDGVGGFSVFFTYNEVRKLLGLFTRSTPVTLQSQTGSEDACRQFISWFFVKDYGAIIQALS